MHIRKHYILLLFISSSLSLESFAAAAAAGGAGAGAELPIEARVRALFAPLSVEDYADPDGVNESFVGAVEAVRSIPEGERDAFMESIKPLVADVRNYDRGDVFMAFSKLLRSTRVIPDLPKILRGNSTNPTRMINSLGQVLKEIPEAEHGAYFPGILDFIRGKMTRNDVLNAGDPLCYHIFPIANGLRMGTLTKDNIPAVLQAAGLRIDDSTLLSRCTIILEEVAAHGH